MPPTSARRGRRRSSASRAAATSTNSMGRSGSVGRVRRVASQRGQDDRAPRRRARHPSTAGSRRPRGLATPVETAVAEGARRRSGGSGGRCRRRWRTDGRPSSAPSRPGESRNADSATSACIDGSCEHRACRGAPDRGDLFLDGDRGLVGGLAELGGLDEDRRAAAAAVGTGGDRRLEDRTAVRIGRGLPVTVGSRGCSG